MRTDVIECKLGHQKDLVIVTTRKWELPARQESNDLVTGPLKSNATCQRQIIKRRISDRLCIHSAIIIVGLRELFWCTIG